MKKILVILVTLLILSIEGQSQLWKLKRYEVVASLGTTQFYGDIGGFSKGENLLGLKDFSFKQTRFNFTTALKYRILDDVSIRLNFAFGSFHATDVRGSNENRGFESKTTFFEPSIMGEYYFIKNKDENSYLSIKVTRSGFRALFPAIDVFAFGGFGGLSYKIKPNEKLAPFTTETSGFTPVIPIGVGVNLFYSSYFNFGASLGGRLTFSDNLDGYSSVYSKSNDLYYFFNFTFTYKIKTGDNGLPTF